ncbi:unnamed protein product [Ectocarpus sp. 8 AP-2014]
MDSPSPGLHLTKYFSPAHCLVRRRAKHATPTPSIFNPGRGVCRRHGLVAMLLVADRSRVVDAFGGVAVGVASALRAGSPPGSECTAAVGMAPPSSCSSSSSSRCGGQGRRMMVRPRPATLAPTTDAGEGRALSG